MIARLRSMLKRLLASDRGAIAVEFAMVAPAMIVMVLGVTEVGRYYWVKSSLDFAVEEATRFAAVRLGATASEITTMVENRMTGLDPAGVSIVLTESVDAATGMTFRDVQASMPFELFLGTMPKAQLTVVARSKFLVTE